MPHLIVRTPGQVALAVQVHDGFRAGRHEQNDLALIDAKVSRNHLRIGVVGDAWTLEDLGSTHGTHLNGQRVQRSCLRDGDRIQLGHVVLTFTEQEPGTIVHEQKSEVGPPRAGADETERRLGLFYEVSRAIGALGNTDDLLGRMLQAILEVLGASRAVVALGGPPPAELRQVVRTRDAASLQGDIVISRAVLDALLVRRQGIIVRGGAAAGLPGTMVRQHVLSAMGGPLIAGERLLGFLYVDDQERADRFGPRDLDFLNALAHLTAAALDSAERYQRSAALAEAAAADAFPEILGQSAVMIELKSRIARYAAANANVLIRGETGTGKELVARALHAASARAGGPFVTLNCAAIPEGMIESELFGHEKGAFTGALRTRKGRFALAHRGTLFLDEIGDLDLAAQAKLLRALQEGEILPLGADRPLRVDVRVLAATHKDLKREIATGRFREDLYYRLAVVETLVPPLRERGGDVALIAERLLTGTAAGAGRRLAGFSPEALAALCAYPWPGNVRELRNEVERAAIHAEGERVTLRDLSAEVAAAVLKDASAVATAPAAVPAAASDDATAPGMTLAQRFAAIEPSERALVVEALSLAHGNMAEAARLLGISWIMMKRRVERYGLKGSTGP